MPGTERPKVSAMRDIMSVITPSSVLGSWWGREDVIVNAHEQTPWA